MFKFFKYLIISAIIFASANVKASHLMGGEITWECMGNGSYIFSMKLYRDCNGIPFNATTLNMEVHNHPSVSFITMNKTGDNDISPQCTGGGPSITCGGGGNGAVQELIFTSAPITLSGVPPAAGWIYTFDSCCRNGAITNLVGPSGTGFTLRAKMFGYNAQNTNPCYDSSPSFSTKPTTIVCTGVPFTYNQLAFDKDGDSLVYSWAQPLNSFSGAFTPTNPSTLAFSGSYSFNNPYPNTSHHASNVPATLDPNTGEISFTSFTQGNFVNCVKVSAYKCGQLVAEVYREIQVIVLPCAVNAPPSTSYPFVDALGDPSFNDTVVAGELINFQYCGYDSPGQLITMSVIGDQFGTNYANPNAGCQNPPCAILGPPPLPSISGTDSVCIFFQWQTGCAHLTSSSGCAATSSTYQFLFTIQDDACPTAGLNIGTISITIIPPEPIESPLIHCVSVIPNGDVILTWDTPIDTVGGFNGYEIFHSSNPTGPFFSEGIVNNYNQTNYTHVGANGNSGPQYYYIQSLGCAQGNPAAPLDTVSSIYLTASGSGNLVNLNWNPTHIPLLASSSTWYRIYREQPIGTWTLIDSTQTLAYIDSVSFCDTILSYRVEIDDGLPCTSMSSIDTVAMSGGAANFSDFTFTGTCLGDSTQFIYVDLGGPVITDYHWDFGDGDTSNVVNPIHYYNTPGNYSVSLNASSSTGCTDSTAKIVTIDSIPIVSIPQDTTICQNSALQLNASGGSSYLWTPGASLNNDTISNPIANPTSTTNYILLVTDTNGCMNTDSILVDLFTIPNYDAGPDTSICLNDSVQLNASGGLIYNWFSNSTLSDTSIFNPWATPITSTYYYVTITDSNSCNFIDSVLVTVNALPVLITSDAAICIGDTTQLMVSGADQYAWTPPTGLNDTSIFNPLAFPLITTVYTVSGTDTNGCINSGNVTVTVNPLPLVDAGLDTTVCAGTSLIIGGSPTGPTGSLYNWTPIASLNDPTLANPTATPTINPTEYIVIVTDTNGCINTDSVVISIDPLPILITNNDTSVCIGTCAQLNVAGAISYVWTPGSSLSDSTIFNPVACTSTTTTYLVTGTNINGCVDTASTTITIDPLPIVDAGNDQDICIGDTISIGGTPTGPTGSSYSWIPALSLDDATLANPAATPIVTTTYIVTVTDTNGCIDVDTIIITVNPLPIVDAGLDTTVCAGTSLIIGGSPTGPSGSLYSWTPIASLNDPTLGNPTATPSINPTEYIVIVTDTNGCINTDSVIISIDPLPILVTNNDTSVCIGTCAQLNVSGAISYVWTPGSSLSDSTIFNPVACTSTTTTYLVTGTDANGCVDTASTTITIDPLPIVDAGNDQDICIGDTIIIGGTPTGPTGSNYSWIPALSLDDATLANPSATPVVTTTYIVTVTDTNGCIDVDTIIITVNPLPIVDAGLDTTVCAGTSLIIGGSPTGPSGSLYNWTPVASLNDPTLGNPTATPTVNPTEYIVIVTDTNGCINTDSVIISIDPLPILVTNNDTSVCIGTCAQLNVAGAISYVWTPGSSLSDSTIFNPVACTSTTTTYLVTGTNINGCVDTASTTITIDPLPIVDAGNDQAICIGDTIIIGGTPTGPTGSNYSWIPALSLDDATLANPSATPIVTTTYIVTVTDTNGCIDVDTIIITVNPLPIVDAGLDTTVCAGTSLIIGGSPTGPIGSLYSWTPIASLNDPTLANPTATPTINPTEYIVIVTDTNGCINTDSVVISIDPLPILITNNDTSVCIGTCAQLNVAGAISYVWTPGSSLSDSTIFNPVACTSTTTTYLVTGTNINGCVDTASTTITIDPLPIVDAGNDQDICIGDTISIGGTPTGPTGSSYSWIPALSLDDATLSNPAATPVVTTTYIVTVTDTNGCIDADTIIITVNPLPLVDAGLDTSLCIGDTIPLNASGANTYIWTPNTDISDPNIFNPDVYPSITTTYFVSGVDTNGCINTDSVIVTVNMLPIIFTSNDTTICTGDCAQLIATGGSNYLWSPGGNLSNPLSSNPLACPTILTTYSVMVTDTNNCVDTSSVTISINQLPVIDAGPDLWLCSGDSIQLNVTGAVSYLWTPSLGLSDTAIFNPMASPTDTAVYYVTGIDTNSCSNTDTLQIIVNDEVPINPGSNTTICAGDSIMLGGLPTSPNGTSFSWFPNGGTMDNDTLSNPIAFPLVTTTYYIVATNDTCTAIDSITITVNQLPIISAGADIDICIGDTAQLNVTGGNSYVWQPGISLNDSSIFNPLAFINDTTEFYVIGTDTNGCSSNDTVIVNVNPLPIIVASGAATNVCIGDTLQLNATGGINYLWTPSLGLSDSTISNPKAFPFTTTTYIVTGTDANLCSSNDSITITINQLSITDLTDTVICIGEDLQLTVTGPSNATYIWSPATDLSDPTIFNPVTSTITTVNYIVIVTDTNGCMDTTSIIVNAESKPVTDFIMETTPSCEGISVEFTNLSTGATSYLWDFGDGTQSTEINPTHTFVYSSSSSIILTAYSMGLCIDTSGSPISSGKFEDYFNLLPPTILTPNGDGINDIFKLNLPNEINECTNIQVFNRWGTKVFESDDQANGWNGKTSSGKKVPDGTYFYIIDINGFTKKGSLTLMK